MGPSIFRALLTVVPVGVVAWLYAVSQFPGEYLVRISLLIAAMMLAFTIGGIWAAERNRSYIRSLATWAEHIGRGGDISEPLLSNTDPDGDRIAQSLRKVVRKHRRQSQRRSRELDRLLTILAYMNDGVMILNKAGRVRTMNPAACELFDSTFEDAKGRTFVQVVRDHRIAEVWQEAEREQRQAKQTLEFGERLFRVVATPFLHGKARGFLVILQDLTELNHLQTVRQTFVTNVSHELRTPLASLRALAETLSEGALEDPPAARRFLGRMEVEVDALTSLVDELFDLSRIESGQIALELELIAPHVFVTNSVDRLTSQAARANIDVTIDVPEMLPPVQVDRERMEQVMVNLIHNAIKFTLPNGKINVVAVQVNGDINVAVEDTGMGIAEEHLPHVFERFYKADSSRRGVGSGVGLAIAKHIVQAHDGEIWADSVEGQGSTFSFSLPVSE